MKVVDAEALRAWIKELTNFLSIIWVFLVHSNKMQTVVQIAVYKLKFLQEKLP